MSAIDYIVVRPCQVPAYLLTALWRLILTRGFAGRIGAIRRR